MLPFRMYVLVGTAVTLSCCGDDSAVGGASATSPNSQDASGPGAPPAPPSVANGGSDPTYCDELLPPIALADDGLPDVALHKLLAPHCIDFGFISSCVYDKTADTTTCATSGGANSESFDTISVRWSASLQGTAFGNRAGQSAVTLGSLSGFQWPQAGIFYFEVNSEASWKMFVPSSRIGFNRGRCHVRDRSTAGVELCGPD